MADRPETPQPAPGADERELLLAWLDHLRASLLRELEDLSEEQARWRPDGALISVLGVVNHLTHVEGRWIDGRMRGAPVSRSESEFSPGPELTVDAAARRARRRHPGAAGRGHRPLTRLSDGRGRCAPVRDRGCPAGIRRR